ncbi:MAG: glycosyltransferase [Flavobacteriales bacterium]
MPIIRTLQNVDCNITLVAENRPAAFLEKEFPELEIVPCLSYGIVYPEKGKLNLSLLKQGLKKVSLIQKEQDLFESIAKKYQFDGVISDNRFGCFLKNKPSVILTHQVNISMSWWGYSLVNRLNKKLLNRFNEVWIVDYEDSPGLAGALSHPPKGLKKFTYIGPLSRFNSPIFISEKKYAWMGLISGPENQRTVFEHLLEKEFSKLKSPCVILRGVPEGEINTPIQNGNITFYNHLNSERLSYLIASSEKLVCRSGYSTLMDLDVFGKKAILVPTPDQSEQEYLAKENEKNGRHFYSNQKSFSVKSHTNDFELKSFEANSNNYSAVINSWINKNFN